MTEKTYLQLNANTPEITHHYGDNVHLVSDAFGLTQLAQLCSPDSVPPQTSQLIRELYGNLLRIVVNNEFPKQDVSRPTRMAEYTDKGVYQGTIVDPTTQVTTVDIARAGIIPSQTCFDTLSSLLNPASVRQDHVMMSRITAEDQKVTGAGFGGMKLAGPVDGRILLFPDPMGATGSSLSTAIQFYKDQVKDTPPAKIITLNLIVTPEFIQKVKSDHPDVIQYAYRLDRGMSDAQYLSTTPGTHWEQETGLTENHYIVPGGGGFGEILNNALE